MFFILCTVNGGCLILEVPTFLHLMNSFHLGTWLLGKLQLFVVRVEILVVT